MPMRIIESNKGSYDTFEKFLIRNPSTIGIILGARGTGKSALGLRILENLHEFSKKKFHTMGFKQDDLPPWIHAVENTSEIENNSYVLIDEGGILFSARQSFSDANKLLSELLLIARHKDVSVLFISQNSANLEINILRQADYLLLKPSSLLQLDFERKKIKDIYTQIMSTLEKYRNVKGLTYVYAPQFTGFIANPLPTFWSDTISKSFRDKKN
jgi:Cdc6-like AAA superfamily ATPase